MGHYLKSFAINLLVFLLATAVALLLGEFVVRLVAPQKLYRFPQFMFVEHPTAVYSLAPNFDGYASTTEYKTRVITNSLGLREPREFQTESEDMYRIVAIGDSFTLGVGVNYEDTFLQKIEELHSMHFPDSNLEIINMGVPGYRIAQAFALLESIGIKLNPSLIMLNLYVGNDIVQSLTPASIQVIHGYLRGPNPAKAHLPPAVRHVLQVKSHLYQLVWPIQRQILDPEFVERRRRSELQSFSIYAEKRHLTAKDMWEATRIQLSKLAEIGQQNKIPILVIIIPEHLQVDEEQWQLTAERLGNDGDSYRRNHPGIRIAEMCEELGIEYVDLLDSMTRAAAKMPLYFEIDGHWNLDGNRLAAQSIYEHMSKNGLIN